MVTDMTEQVRRPGNPTNRKDLEEGRRNVGEMNKTTTARVPSGRGWRKIGRCVSSKLRPSPNHGTLWLHKGGDVIYMSMLVYVCLTTLGQLDSYSCRLSGTTAITNICLNLNHASPVSTCCYLAF